MNRQTWRAAQLDEQTVSKALLKANPNGLVGEAVSGIELNGRSDLEHTTKGR